MQINILSFEHIQNAVGDIRSVGAANFGSDFVYQIICIHLSIAFSVGTIRKKRVPRQLGSSFEFNASHDIKVPANFNIGTQRFLLNAIPRPRSVILGE